MMYYTSLARKS